MLACVADIGAEWYCEPTRRAEFTQLLQTNGRVVDFVSEICRHKTRECIWVREHAHLVSDLTGQVLYFEGTVEDITQEVRTWRDLQASESRFRAMTALSSDWYWELDANFRFVRLDVGKHSSSVGVNQQVLGKTRQELAHIDLSASQWASYQALLDAKQVFHDFEFPIRALNGDLIWHAISGEPMFSTEGIFLGFRGIGRDVSARRQSEALIRQMAFHDPLTGLANRRLFMDRLELALAGMARTGQRGVLMFLDLDKFKSLNDLQGHSTGDMLLQHVSQRLKACVRGVDTVARLGGDEFTILLEDAGSDDVLATRHAKTVADKVLGALQLPFKLDVTNAATAYQSSASLGVVVLNDPKHNADQYLKWADAAMYMAKAGGRNCICFGAENRGS